jgi:H+/Cl- antiporter ClcA
MSQTTEQEKKGTNTILWAVLVAVVVIALAIRFAFPDAANYLSEVSKGVEASLANYDPLTWAAAIVVIIVAFAVIAYIARSRK